ncbi:ATP-grasp domain-containing protein [Shouchella patagoniensis]|uniref:ATP-grasp domain-containing protein n=1 Tax=Shouchella patagoniensis TaxID=228576 RepID=UPI000995A2B1|nr:ATP-grasp domain-containing protein [Shouchella patagoniensis]
MNVLITSAGRRVKVIEYFRKELNKIGGRVFAADCDKTAPALNFADTSLVILPIVDEKYIDELLEICRSNEISAVISLIDPELEILSENKSLFKEIGVEVIVSPLKEVKLSFNKFNMYEEFIRKSIPVVPTYNSVENTLEALNSHVISFPIILKPGNGSASIGIRIINSEKELREAFFLQDNLIAQPYIQSDEYGVDVYIDIYSKEVVNLFIKRKIKMRAGETDKSISIKNKAIQELILNTLKHYDFIGPLDFDIFEYNGTYCISEINPRFGGGYPHAYELGQNFISSIITNLQGNSNDSIIGDYEKNLMMIKYDNVLIKEI